MSECGMSSIHELASKARKDKRILRINEWAANWGLNWMKEAKCNLINLLISA